MLASATCGAAGQPGTVTLPRLIPAPAHWQSRPGQLGLQLPLRVDAAAAESSQAFSLLLEYAGAMGLAWAMPDDLPEAQGTPVRLEHDASLGAEAYRLRVDADGIRIQAADANGAIYAVQSLRQLLFAATSDKHGASLPFQLIEDAPRFAYRGMHLDVSRHFFDVDFLKRYLDLLVMHKFNTFHWHLSDDQGWRLESKRFPRLVSVGSVRAGTVVGHALDADAHSDGQAYGGYYSHADVLEVLAYAAQRGVTVVPEIDVPGHASALLAAYPALGGQSGTAMVQQSFGVFDEVLCPSDEVFAFLDALFGEVAELFPGPYLHIGGDEVPPLAWDACRAAGMEGSADELYRRFVSGVDAIVRRHGKRAIGWDEILDAGIGPGTTVMSWRGMQGGIAAARAGHDVIMTPVDFAYFDFHQSESLDEPLSIHGLTRLADVYRFNPVPVELDAGAAARVIGGQGNLWTEYIAEPARAEWAVLPRMSALAEVLWTPYTGQDWSGFQHRLPTLEAMLRSARYNVADSHYKPQLQVNTVAPGHWEVSMSSSADAMVYTLDGSAPTVSSRRYRKPLRIDGDATVRAAGWRTGQDEVVGDVRMTFLAHQAVGQTATLADGSDAGILVDGIIASDRGFRYPDWLGFGAGGMDLGIEYAAHQTVTSVSIGIAAARHRRLRRPDVVTVTAVDADGREQVLARASRELIDASGERIELQFAPRQLSRLRVLAGNGRQLNLSSPPAQTLFIDEVVVR